MFNIARVKFLAGTNLPVAGGNASKLYDYRIPAHLDGVAKVGDLAIVSWKGVRGEGGQINPTLTRIEEVCNVLDGDYEKADFAFLVGVVDPSRHEARIANERKREKLRQLIKAERKRVAETLELESLLMLSPSLQRMVEQMKQLDRDDEADAFADAFDRELGRTLDGDYSPGDEVSVLYEDAAIDEATQRQIDRNGN